MNRAMLLRLTLLLCLGASAAVAAAPGAILAKQGRWAALRFTDRCVAQSRPLPPAAERRREARAGFSFAPSAGLHGEFHVLLSREPRPGSSVLLVIGSRPFLLRARGSWAWSDGAAQEAAIIEAARWERSMRVEARDPSGRRFADRYLLNGAPTAIDAAAAGCGWQNRGPSTK